MQASNSSVEEKDQEILVIAESDTVPNPWTMMVHSHYAISTNGAVMSARWLHLLAFQTVSVSYELFWTELIMTFRFISFAGRYFNRDSLNKFFFSLIFLSS